MSAAANQPTRAIARRINASGFTRLLRNDVLRAAMGACLIAAVAVLLRNAGWLQPAELVVYDTLRAAWAGTPSSSPVLLVGATENDITAGNQKDGRRWGWPVRDGKLAQVLERIASWQPRAIGVDLYRDMAEPPGTDQLDALLRRHPEIFWVFKLKDDEGHPGIAPPAAVAGTGREVLADIVEDSGGVVRRGLLFADDGVNQYPSMAMALALAYLQRERISLQPGQGDGLRLGKAVFEPLDQSRGIYSKLDSRGYQVLLDYHGGTRAFQPISLSAVMDRDDLGPLVRDRVVIVGVAAESVKDSFATPFCTGINGGDPMDGIAIHAHLADQLIRASMGSAPMLEALPRLFEDAWIVFWALAGAMLGLMVRSTIPAAGGAGAGLLAIGALVYVAFGRSLWLPAIPAALAWVTSAGLTNQLLHAASNRARAQLRQSFERYLPPQVIADMIKAHRLPSLGGERREISVLFTDVAGFTTFSEERDPEELARITNEYFDGVCAAIFDNGGLVNAFLGDGVLAFFGAPQEQLDHADRAIDAALDIDRFAQQFSADHKARGIAFGHTRIGIHCGLCFVGNVGAKQRLQYTALGDVLNTASRLEGLNKAIGTRICVSKEVAARCQRHEFQPIGAFVVKGRREATEVFTPFDAGRRESGWRARYELAYRELQAGSPQAAERFAALQREDPPDACVVFHCRRLAQGETGTRIEMHEK